MGSETTSTEVRARQRRLGLPRDALPLWALEGLADHTDAIEAAANLLGRGASYVDPDGYERDIIAAAIDSDGQRVAWVESKYKEKPSGHVDVEYRLFARAEDERSTEWEVETYNPFFGCHVYEMSWQGDWVYLTYHEKHDIYRAAVSLDGHVNRVRAQQCWPIGENEVGYAGNGAGRFERRAWPTLELLGQMTLEEAKAAGMPEEAQYRYGRANRQAALSSWNSRWLTYPALAAVLSVVFVGVSWSSPRLSAAGITAVVALFFAASLIAAWRKW